MLKNENRRGYKKTKVGWIPDEWKCVSPPIRAQSTIRASTTTIAAARNRSWKGRVALALEGEDQRIASFSSQTADCWLARAALAGTFALS